MTTFEAFSFGIAFIAGNAMMFVCSNRARATENLQDRLLKVASNLWRDAVEANQSNDPCVIKLHNQLIELAALAPGIASGIIISSQNTSMTPEEMEDLDEFLNRNAWVPPHIFTGYLALLRLEFYARPWKIPGAWKALQAWVLMTFCCDGEGSITLSRRTKDTVGQVEDFVRLDTSRHADGLILAP